jgi:xanthine dehydrogenase molybdopterin-binding subunit B
MTSALLLGSKITKQSVYKCRGTSDRYAVVDDVGRAINSMICEGQIIGGIAQGLGQAMLEEIVYDDEGQILTGSFMDYAMPRARDVGHIKAELAEFPSKTNPLGVKGVGESGAIGAPPAIANAVVDALRGIGVTNIDMPFGPHKVWHAIQAASNGQRFFSGVTKAPFIGAICCGAVFGSRGGTLRSWLKRNG